VNVVAVIVVCSFITGMTTFMFVWSTRRMLAWSEKAIQNQRELIEAKRQLAIKVVELEVERARKSMGMSASANALDEKTKALVRLAVSNPSEHERQNAALIACKRLKDQIDD
jgi:hypothetical protein